jgi:acyl carrier protein
MEDHVKRLMADVLDLNAKAIDERTVRDGVASWDSLKHISLCLALEEEFKVSFEVHEMEDMLSYKDVLRILRQKL